MQKHAENLDFEQATKKVGKPHFYDAYIFAGRKNLIISYQQSVVYHTNKIKITTITHVSNA